MTTDNCQAPYFALETRLFTVRCNRYVNYSFGVFRMASRAAKQALRNGWSLERNPPLGLGQRRQIFPPIVELCGARVGMIGHILAASGAPPFCRKTVIPAAPECVIARTSRTSPPRGSAP